MVIRIIRINNLGLEYVGHRLTCILYWKRTIIVIDLEIVIYDGTELVCRL